VIIDVHCHLWGESIPSKDYWDEFVRVSVSVSGGSEQKIRERLPGWWDLSGDMLISDMDRAGVDRSVLLTTDFALGAGTGDTISLEKLHEIYAQAVERHPGRLVAFAGVDPRRPQAAKFLEKAVREWGMKGLKLVPVVGFYPNDNRCYLLYQKCVELEIPVIIHTGPEAVPGYSKYGQPVLLDEVANDFPDLKIIMAHAGLCWWEEAATIASNKPNVYLDVSWWQPRFLVDPVTQFYRPLRSMISMAGPSKVLFGSDWPVFRQMRKLDHEAWVNVFKRVPEEIEEAGIRFTDDEIRALLGDNAGKLLGS